ncbi:hypothetical protein C8Q80DRAFT_1178172 [Daedaleopsis nitida]|nr:hypothetical protein C8Q80DRAFT_1178172 [Daedaleopsis nitida]
MDGQAQNNGPPGGGAGQQNQQGQLPAPPQNPQPVLRDNPHQAQCPDFASGFFEDMRNALIQSNVAADQDGAVAELAASWADKNTRDKERWDEQQARQQAGGNQPQAPLRNRRSSGRIRLTARRRHPARRSSPR